MSLPDESSHLVPPPNQVDPDEEQMAALRRAAVKRAESVRERRQQQADAAWDKLEKRFADQDTLLTIAALYLEEWLDHPPAYDVTTTGQHNNKSAPRHANKNAYKRYSYNSAKAIKITSSAVARQLVLAQYPDYEKQIQEIATIVHQAYGDIPPQ